MAMLFAVAVSVEGAKLEGISIDLRQESLKGCSLSSLNKCYGSLPPDGSTPSNLLEEIGQIADAQTCQSFCKDLYPGACTWFMFDRTTNDCKLFSGSLDDLRADCKEVGYAKEPAHASCDVVFDSGSENGCYNFREDYCRFEFSLLENLEDIATLSECQLACEYINNCSYFVYDSPTKICKLNTMASNRPVCDIIHGTPEPDFNTCVNDGQLDWASNETNTQSGQSTSKECSSYTKIHDGKFCDGLRSMGDRDDNGDLFNSAQKCFEYITNPNSKKAKECDGEYFGWNSRDFWTCRCSTSGCSTLVNSGSDTYQTDCQ